jgi:predicted TIM-barrel fold metal-dependent hydrolase
MPVQEYMKLISVDDHLFEHPRVWSDRLPAKFQEVGPTIIVKDNHDCWLYEGEVEPAFHGLSVGALVEKADISPVPKLAADLIPGVMDPSARLLDMDEGGIWAQLCFPTFPRFAGTRFLIAKDKELALLCVRAYNDFVLDEWCSVAPDRYIPLCILPLWDVSLAVAEFHRVVGNGACSVTFPEQTLPLDLPTIHTGYWDPLFAVASEASIPLSIHYGTSGRIPRPTPDGPDASYISLMSTNSMATCSEFCFSHVFHSFPGLKLALSEGGIGWIPWLKERMDYVFERQQWSGINTSVKPSELFDGHIYGCSFDDEIGMAMRHQVGLNNITLEADYPHSDSSWPFTWKRASELLRDVPDDEAHRIVELNARGLYNFH